MKRRTFLSGSTAALALSAFSPRLAIASQTPRILTSFSILQDMVSQIAPTSFQIDTLVPANADAHVFSPKPSDARRIREAELIFFNGLGFEGWFTRLIQSAGYKGSIIQSTQSIAPRKVRHQIDPHAWQSLANGAAYAAVIRDALMHKYPDYKKDIEQRAAQYISELNHEHVRTRLEFATLPADRRRAITAHDAFAYFGEAYGIEFLAPQGWSTHSAPSAAAIARLIRFAKSRGAKGIFLENISDSRQIEQIAKESGAQVGGTLYSDALSGAEGPASTYLKMLKHNSNTLLNVLQT